MEKNMKKNTARNRAVSTLLLALSAAFILAGCFNPLDPVDPAPQSGTGALSVSIAGQGSGVRTLYPNPAFTKYVLTFASAGESYGPQTLTGTSSEVFNDIPAGDWIITAIGYVTINGQEYAAAEGSQTASIVAGQTASVNIPISAEQGGDNGFFYYNVTFPDGEVDTATLTLSRYSSGSYYSVVDPVDLKTSASGYVGASGLTPGYYRVDVRLQNDYQSAGISEVVHIYSNMETKAEYAYTEADFVDIVTLSGTINATVNGEAPGMVYISAYVEGEPDSEIGSTNISYSSGAEWSISVPAFSEATTVAFRVRLFDSSPFPDYIGSVSDLSSTQVHNEAVPDIGLNVDYGNPSITLSGTINATLNGEAPSRVSIYAYAEDNEDDEIGSTSVNPYSSGAEWSISVPAFSEETTVIFNVELYDSSNNRIGYVSGLNFTQVHNEASPDIELYVDCITLSGTINATANGEAPSRVYISAFAAESVEMPIWIGSTSVNPYSSGAEWSIIVPAFSVATTVTFNVSFFDSSSNYISVSDLSSTQVHNKAVPNIELDVNYGNPSSITLSGTINATANGEAPSRVSIYAYAEGNQIGSTSVNPYSSGAEWSISVPAFSVATTVTFGVDLYASSGFGSVSNLSSTQVHNEAVPDIVLNVDYGNPSSITLSGTINATANGSAPYQVEIFAYAEGKHEPIGSTSVYYSSGAEWSISVPAFSVATAVTFNVSLYGFSGSLGSVSNLSSTQVHNEAVPAIELNVDYSYVTLSGTINATANGSAPDMVSIFAYAEGKEIGSRSVAYSSGAAWSINVPAFSVATTVTFSVSLYQAGSPPFYDYIGSVSDLSSTQVHNEAVSGIELNVDYSSP